MAAEFHVGDVGTIIQVTVTDGTDPVDVGDPIDIRDIHFEDPDGTIVTKAGALVDDGSDGKIKYVTEADFLSKPGVWRLQVELEWANGNHWSSSKAEFRVHPNLQ